MKNLWVNFEMIRQYFYCKRIVFFRICMKYTRYKSYKMEKGTEYHEKKFKREEKEKVNVWVEDEKRGIRGFIDFIKIEEGKTIIGDYKQKEPLGGKIQEHYKMQLVAEKMALENKEKISYVEIKFPKGKRIREEVRKEEEEEVNKAIREIREMIEKEVLPDETKEQRKCTDCEYKRICQPL